MEFTYNDYGCDALNVSVMEGLKIISVDGLEKDSEEAIFTTECGRQFKMFHVQDCCESVSIDDVCGEISDLIGATIIHFEERISDGDDESKDKPSEWCESFRWTFYDIQTDKGCVNIKWLGESNGYCSESVTLAEGEKVMTS